MNITQTVVHPADPQRIFEMLTDHDYQVQRCQRAGSLDQTVTVDRQPDGVTTVTTQRHLPADGVPDVAKAFIGPKLLTVETVRWGTADADGEREGAMTLEVPGVPVTFIGGMFLRRGSREGTTEHVVEGDLEAKIPFFGKKVEQQVAARITGMVELEQQLAAEWLARS
jgi:hypothetical protein